MTLREEIIGDARLYLGDCRDILPTLPKVDAVITDPPYGISDAPMKGQGRTGKRRGASNDWHAETTWDDAINPEWCRLVCSAAAVVAWFGHWRKRGEVEAAMQWPLRAEIVWAKDCHVGPPCPLAMRDERIWLFAEKGIVGAHFETTVWDEPIIPTWARKEHKNEKPVRLMERVLRFLNPMSVVDPFMGSGTTGVACLNGGRTFYGIEQDAAHFETACRRIEDAQRQVRLFA
jgi:DNA modification methylase